MKSFIAVLLLVLALWFFAFREDSVELGPGVKVSEVPVQGPIKGIKAFAFRGYRIIPKAGFIVKGKVLSRENYYSDRNSEISPLDIALGWGRMSDEKVLDKIDISQGGRWYRWYTDNFPIPRREIETCSANMHMIPSTPGIEKELQQIRKGDIVRITGMLVNVEGRNNYRWNSSLTRNDTGDGACEIIFVTRVDILETR